MTSDDIIKMAREAECEETWGADAFKFGEVELERFAHLVAASEREACAELVEASPSYDWHRFACEAATAIRSRGKL